MLAVSYVWKRFIDAAIDRDVNAVVLTGDIVDAENKMYEAYGALERGIQQLLAADISVVAVAGNHDYDAFPRLVSALDDERFHLLGRGGQWDAVQVESVGGPAVQFVGWSFPEATITASPLEGFDLPPADGPTVGVLHCEAGRTESRYAPVGRDDLARSGPDAWLLGHIHASNAHWEGDQLQLYPGSLQPLDPGEQGTHGCWEITVDATGSVDARDLPLATLRYDRTSIDVSGLGETEVESTVLEEVQSALRDAKETCPEVRHVANRLIFEGRTQIHQAIELQALDMVDQLQTEVDGAVATVEGYEMRTRPDYDLQALASGNDPMGVLAQLLIDLENDDANSDGVEALLRSANKNVDTIHQSSRYEPLRRDSETRGAPTRDNIGLLVRREGYRLLDELHKKSD
jgi:DNA repair exonuclease SbcCD nuclease subunit